MALPRIFEEEVRAALRPDAVISEPEQLRTYECDGLTSHRVVPALVVLPETAEQVQAVVRACARQLLDRQDPGGAGLVLDEHGAGKHLA